MSFCVDDVDYGLKSCIFIKVDDLLQEAVLVDFTYKVSIKGIHIN